MNYWVLIYRCAWGLVLALCIVVLVCVFLPKYHKHRRLQIRLEELQAQNRKTERQTNELRENQEQFQSDAAFVEETARKIGLIKLNETVFKYTNMNSESESDDQQ